MVNKLDLQIMNALQHPENPSAVLSALATPFIAPLAAIEDLVTSINQAQQVNNNNLSPQSLIWPEEQSYGVRVNFATHEKAILGRFNDVAILNRSSYNPAQPRSEIKMANKEGAVAMKGGSTGVTMAAELT